MSIWNRIRHSYKLAKAIEFVAPLNVLAGAVRLARFNQKLKTNDLALHFGCGSINDRRFLNIDARRFAHVDYVTASPLMPSVPSNCANLIYACHVFEHFPFRHQGEILLRWKNILTPGGSLMLSVPDFEKLSSYLLALDADFENAQGMLMGGQDYPGNVHFAVFTDRHLRKVLSDAGFVNIRQWEARSQASWPRDWSWREDISLNLMADKPLT